MSPALEFPLQREIHEGQLSKIMQSPLFCAMQQYIKTGKILPALRKNEVHFYEAGARLLRFTDRRIYTHRRYIGCDGSRERVLREDEQNAKTLEKIREVARGYRHEKKPDSELVAVHQLFKNFAITRGAHRPGDLALTDVEARFAAGDCLPSKMIDLVFLLADHRLLFVEAKCVGNREVRSTNEAKVASQVKCYERHIKRNGVLDALNRSLRAQSELVGRDLGRATSISWRVPLLVLDPDGRGLPRRSRDTWLKTALEKARVPPIGADVLVIDGMRDPEAAIRKFVRWLPA